MKPISFKGFSYRYKQNGEVKTRQSDSSRALPISKNGKFLVDEYKVTYSERMIFGADPDFEQGFKEEVNDIEFIKIDNESNLSLGGDFNNKNNQN